jgi:hypothetical protein
MVGWPTVKAIVGNALVPAIADRYLASQGFEAQQTDEPVDGNRPDNLFEPVAGDHGAHGPFDDRARGQSLQLPLAKYRAWVLGAASLTAIAIVRGDRE